MITTKELNETEKIIESLRTDTTRTTCALPGNGYLSLEHELPFLIIYKQNKEDVDTLKLTKSKASFLIIPEEEKSFYQELCSQIANEMSGKFGSFLILELHTGSLGSTTFKITGNIQKFPVTIDALHLELKKLERRRSDTPLSIEVENINLDDDFFLDIKTLESNGAQFLQLEVPPVSRSAKGQVYPIYFRRFRKAFIKAIQKALFEYARVQTSCKINSYTALGKRKIDKNVLKIDKQLFEIQAGYEFLLLVAPTNINEIRKHFFDSKFKHLQEYHYRMLPVDPDILKRHLFNLRIEDIDDPAIAYLFDEKREEIDQELNMLKERGKPGFFQRSIRLYRGVEKSLVKEAKVVLEKISEDDETDQKKSIDAKSFSKMAEEEFDYFRKQSPEFDSKIHIRDDVNIIMVQKGELYLPSNYVMSESEAISLIQHEIGTHVLTYYNGKQQPLYQMAIGLADYDPLQEGIAVFSEYLAGALSKNRLRTIAGRVVAGQALIDGLDFKQTFTLLTSEFGFSTNRAFNITSRIFQGGGFLKDTIYMKGLIELRDYLINGGELDKLLTGKFAIHHVNVINELTERQILKEPAIKPRYMESSEYPKKIQEIKNGLPIYKLAES